MKSRKASTRASGSGGIGASSGKAKLELGPDKYLCSSCSYSSDHQWNVHRHYQRIHTVLPSELVCSLCKKVFKKKDSLYHHRLKFHSSVRKSTKVIETVYKMTSHKQNQINKPLQQTDKENQLKSKKVVIKKSKTRVLKNIINTKFCKNTPSNNIEDNNELNIERIDFNDNIKKNDTVLHFSVDNCIDLLVLEKRTREYTDDALSVLIGATDLINFTKNKIF